MYTIKQLHKKISQDKEIPDENEITLKLYTEYFEKYIEPSFFEVELTNGKILKICVEAAQVAHIMGLHSFYDPKHKLLRFSGMLSKIDGYINMKKGKISLKELKASRTGNQWKNENNKYRVLCFPFIREAFLKGDWYCFDITKYNGNTKVNPQFIVAFKVENIWLNFCIDKKDDKSNYYCVSNLIAHKKNNRIKNQSLLDVSRVIELTDDKIQTVICHNPLYKPMLKEMGKMTQKSLVTKKQHAKLHKEKRKINSNLIDNEMYEVIHLKSDTIK